MSFSTKFASSVITFNGAFFGQYSHATKKNKKETDREKKQRFFKFEHDVEFSGKSIEQIQIIDFLYDRDQPTRKSIVQILNRLTQHKMFFFLKKNPPHSSSIHF